ncbi:hypothetical protein BDZ97DRAFT_1958643 [Flammula alnicola]|nr:hypothetical protein BDZ97DRAFT_1958643 [Flammula alnicola]
MPLSFKTTRCYSDIKNVALARERGKVEPGETPLQAAVRELEEESGVTAPLEHAGSLLFLSEGTEWAFQIEIYRSESYTGVITESDEMRPEWFAITPSTTSDSGDGIVYSPIPFSQMWETDEVWLPLLISKQKFVGRADFTQSGEVVKPYKWWYGTVSN